MGRRNQAGGSPGRCYSRFVDAGRGFPLPHPRPVSIRRLLAASCARPEMPARSAPAARASQTVELVRSRRPVYCPTPEPGTGRRKGVWNRSRCDSAIGVAWSAVVPDTVSRSTSHRVQSPHAQRSRPLPPGLRTSRVDKSRERFQRGRGLPSGNRPRHTGATTLARRAPFARASRVDSLCPYAGSGQRV